MTNEEMQEAGCSAAEYRFKGDRDLRLSWRGEETWAVTSAGACLSRDGTWDHEPHSSSRTEEWLNEHRFTLDEAFRLARGWINDSSAS